MARDNIAQSVRQRLRQHGLGAAVDQHGFSGDPFGIDDLVAVKQQLEIIDKPAVLNAHCVAVDQMAHLDQQLGSTCAKAVFALIDEQTVVGADDQVAVIVQGAGSPDAMVIWVPRVKDTQATCANF